MLALPFRALHVLHRRHRFTFPVGLADIAVGPGLPNLAGHCRCGLPLGRYGLQLPVSRPARPFRTCAPNANGP
jgi:hypothetical protein